MQKTLKYQGRAEKLSESSNFLLLSPSESFVQASPNTAEKYNEKLGRPGIYLIMTAE